MKSNPRLGTCIRCTTSGEAYLAFVPSPLPPHPPLNLSFEHEDLLEKANRALGRLDGLATLIPDTKLLLYSYVRKEALLSSQIEGTQSSLSDLLLYESEEAPGVPMEDVEEVSSYIRALEYGIKKIRSGFPVCLRLFKEVHEILLSTGRGKQKQPGEFRRSQNWIGGSRPGNARFVPPPPDRLMECLGDLEKFLNNDPVQTPLLIKAALSHVQFETIHPFLDGNGRLGRLLITLLLCSEGALQEPLLYLSLYLKTNRTLYYDLLQKVRTEGVWEEWLLFFLKGILETAEQAIETAKKILQLFARDRKKIEGLGRAAISTLRVYEILQSEVILSIKNTSDSLKLTKPTVASSLKHLQDLKIVKEMTGKERHQLFLYNSYFKILNEGTEPL